jgi:hypothetical protein
VRLHIYQSDKGDCILLEAGDGALVLCDGGMRSSMTDFVREDLAERVGGRSIRYAYVSHIDSDHISGVLQLLEDEAEWRVFDLHAATPRPIKPPRVPRPPQIEGILNNAFRDQVGRNSKPIEDLMAAAVPSFFATSEPRLVDVALDLRQIATSVPEALKVSGLAGQDALDIPVNVLPGQTGPGPLLFVDDESGAEVSFTVGSMTFRLIGPTKRELADLRDGWNNWLRNTPDQLARVRAQIKKRLDEFATGVTGDSPFDLRDWNGIPDYKGVTAPNVASMMFMVEEGGQRLLLTGDSHQDKIIGGLRLANFLVNDEHVHVDVLKVQHHGSENNLDADFARAVSADHYVFCGNGEHGNPNPDVVDFIFDSRMGPAAVRALAPEAAGRPFTFWFSTSELQADGVGGSSFRGLARHVRGLADSSGGRLQLRFNENAAITLEL